MKCNQNKRMLSYDRYCQSSQVEGCITKILQSLIQNLTFTDLLTIYSFNKFTMCQAIGRKCFVLFCFTLKELTILKIYRMGIGHEQDNAKVLC